MKILISSSNSATLKRWKDILQNDHQLYEVSSAVELRKASKIHDLDLILIHRSMIDMVFIKEFTNTRFFVLADVPDDLEAVNFLKLGAVGYANTYISAPRLKEAVNISFSGRVWISQKLMQKIIQGTTHAIDEKKTTTVELNLSDREKEVAVLVSKGYSNLEIAAKLDISERTVKAHISSIFKKTNTDSRLQLALLVKELLT